MPKKELKELSKISVECRESLKDKPGVGNFIDFDDIYTKWLAQQGAKDTNSSNENPLSNLKFSTSATRKVSLKRDKTKLLKKGQSPKEKA